MTRKSLMALKGRGNLNLIFNKNQFGNSLILKRTFFWGSTTSPSTTPSTPASTTPSTPLLNEGQEMKNNLNENISNSTLDSSLSKTAPAEPFSASTNVQQVGNELIYPDVIASNLSQATAAAPDAILSKISSIANFGDLHSLGILAIMTRLILW